MRLLLVALFLVGACGGDNTGVRDGGCCVDEQLGGGPDLAEPDLLVEEDLVLAPDLRRPPDFSRSADLAQPDLVEDRDLAQPDLAEPPDLTLAPDLASSPDLMPAPDMTLGKRRIFIAPPHNGDFGGQLANVDAWCQQAADAAKLGRRFIAVVGFAGADPKNRLAFPIDSQRPIVTVGQTLVAYENHWWINNHFAGVDEQADRSMPTSECVWTGFDYTTGVSTESTCDGWSSSTKIGMTTGRPLFPKNGAWAAGLTMPCYATCHVYCMEQ